jgi:hypothetical protein
MNNTPFFFIENQVAFRALKLLQVTTSAASFAGCSILDARCSIFGLEYKEPIFRLNGFLRLI